MEKQKKARHIGRASSFAVPSASDGGNDVDDLVGVGIDDADLVADQDVLISPPLRNDDDDVLRNFVERYGTGNGDTYADLNIDIRLGAAAMALERRLDAGALLAVERNVRPG